MGRSQVALDIGSANLHAVEFTRGRGSPKVRKVASAPLSRGIVEAGEVRDPEALTAALKGLWSEHKLGSKQVVFGVANNSVMVRQLELEWLVPAEFAKALQFRVAEHIPMPVHETNLDYHVLAEYDAPAPDGRGTLRMVRILLVVATSDMVSSFVAPIRAAGLMPVRLDLAPFALIRAVRSAGGDPGALMSEIDTAAEPTDPVALSSAGGPRPGAGSSDPATAEAIVDIGADVTTVLVHRDGQPQYVRILTGHGGNAVTDALVETFQLPLEEAEQAKLDSLAMVGVPSPSDAPSGQSVIYEQAGVTIAEIRDSLDYFMSTSAEVSALSRVVLTGGGSLLRGLQQRLSADLRLPVQVGGGWLHGQPMVGRQRPQEAESHSGSERQLAMAAGLAVGAA